MQTLCALSLREEVLVPSNCDIKQKLSLDCSLILNNTIPYHFAPKEGIRSVFKIVIER